MDRCNENSDVKVKFMRCNRSCLSWQEHDNNYDNKCLVPFQHIFCTAAAPHLHRKHGTIIQTRITCKKSNL